MLPKPENYDEMIRKYRRGEVGERSNLPEEVRKYDAYIRYIKNNPDHPEILDIDNEEEFMRYKHELRIQRISEKQQLTWANPAYKKLRSLMTINQHKKETKEDYDSRISKQRETWANKSDEEKLAHSEHTRNQWANYTDEEKKIINNKHSKTISTTKYKALFRKNSLNYWNELPKERQDEIINNLRGALNEWRNNLTEDDKLKLSAQRSIISKSIWANISAEERHNIAIRSRDTFMSKPESEILAAHRKIGESRKNIWDNMSDEEKMKF